MIHFKEPWNGKKGLLVEVQNNNIDKALKVLKRKMKNENVLNDLKKHDHFITGTERRRKRKNDAINRWNKQKGLIFEEYGLTNEQRKY